jgi:hypothetical protein
MSSRYVQIATMPFIRGIDVNVVAFSALHYGRDYLGSAIRSVIDSVDEYHVAYTASGSHGHRTATPCPETRDELLAIALEAAGDKLRWHDGTWEQEYQQRGMIHQYAPDADMILVLDADEIWHPQIASWAGRLRSGETQIQPAVRTVLMPLYHFWRSFHHAVLHDPAAPVRIIYPKVPDGSETVGKTWLFHFGYCQRPEIVRYKIETHGHKAQWRTDCDWFEDKFMANAQKDVHPVGSEWWNVEACDPYALGLPMWMLTHPYADMEVIE